jgi:hypothetical protein
VTVIVVSSTGDSVGTVDAVSATQSRCSVAVEEEEVVVAVAVAAAAAAVV